MGLFDQVLGSLMGGGGNTSPVQTMLMGLLSGNQGQTGQGQAAQTPALAGGLGGLLATLQQAGLGDVVQSWIGNGANQSVSPQDLHSALGTEQVQAMASQAGLAPHDFLAQLSEHLPNMVNNLTPDGRLPDEGQMSV